MIERALTNTSPEYPGQNISGKGALRDTSPELLRGDQQEIADVMISLRGFKCPAAQIVQRYSEPLETVGRDRIFSIAERRLRLRLGALPMSHIAVAMWLHADGPDVHTLFIPLNLQSGRTVEMLPRRRELIDLLEADCRLTNLENGYTCGRDFFRRQLTQHPRGRGLSDQARAALAAIDGELGELTRQGVLRSRDEIIDALRASPGVRHVTAFHQKVKGIYATKDNEYSFEFAGGKYSSDFPWDNASWIGDEPAPFRDSIKVGAELAALGPRVAELARTWKSLGPRVSGVDCVQLPPGFSRGVCEAYGRLGGASWPQIVLGRHAGPGTIAPPPSGKDYARDSGDRAPGSPRVELSAPNSGTRGNSPSGIAIAECGGGATAVDSAHSNTEAPEGAGRNGAPELHFGWADSFRPGSLGAALGSDEVRHNRGDGDRERKEHCVGAPGGGTDWIEHSTQVDNEHTRKLEVLAERRGRINETLRSAASGVNGAARAMSGAVRALVSAGASMQGIVAAGGAGAARSLGLRGVHSEICSRGVGCVEETARGNAAREFGGALGLHAAVREFAATIAAIEEPTRMMANLPKTSPSNPPRLRQISSIDI